MWASCLNSSFSFAMSRFSPFSCISLLSGERLRYQPLFVFWISWKVATTRAAIITIFFAFPKTIEEKQPPLLSLLPSFLSFLSFLSFSFYLSFHFCFLPMSIATMGMCKTWGMVTPLIFKCLGRVFISSRSRFLLVWLRYSTFPEHELTLFSCVSFVRHFL